MNIRSLIAAMGVLAGGPVLAQVPESAKGFSGEPFGLRFQAALTRFSRFPDVAGLGGASAAAEWGSSINPAAQAWNGEAGGSAQYSLIDFEYGTQLDVLSASYAFETDWGWWQPSLGYAGSNEDTTRQGLDFEYHVGFAELQWGLMSGVDTAIGVNLNFADSNLDFGLGGMPASESDAQSYGIRIGGLYEPDHANHPEPDPEHPENRPYDFWRFGMALDYAVQPSRTRAFSTTTSRDTTQQFYLRPGVAYVYEQSSRVYLDYQYAYFTDDTGNLRVSRFYAGVDHELDLALNIRAGTVIDTHGNVSVAGGLGIFPSTSVFIDIAYQYNMFPEVDLEFGTAQTLGIAVSVSF